MKCPRVSQSIETEHRLLVARVWEEGAMDSNCLFEEGNEMVLELDRGVNVWNSTEMFTLKYLILCMIIKMEFWESLNKRKHWEVAMCIKFEERV